jgi:hypothetical protein
MTQYSQQIIVKNFPMGWVKESDFELVRTPLPPLGADQVLVQNHWLSLDPYMRGRLSAAKSYAKSAQLGEVMVGQAAGVVLESNSEHFKPGDCVLSYSGWQTHSVLEQGDLKRVDTQAVPLSAYLGVLGMPGVTAWTGLIDLCQPVKGETVVVDAASGAVGSVVGQLAKSVGCTVVGIAGGARKCEYVTRELGFDACVDHTSAQFKEAFKAAVPRGIDCVFENVGGAVFETVLANMNPFSRIALCGLVSEYNTQPYGNQQLRSILVNRIRIQGFIVSDKPQTWPAIIDALRKKVISGELKYNETIAHGIEQAPSAFIGLLRGQNLGKQLVKLV